MNKTIKKTISSFLILGFLLNVVLPVREASAMTGPWWSGSQATGSTSVVPAPAGEGNANEGNNNQPVAEPVLVHNGDFVYEHQDILIPSRAMNTEIIRTYKSQSRYNNRFGYGWDIFYNKKIIPQCNGDLYYLNGKLNRHRFAYIDGTNYISPTGIYDKIVQNANGTFTLTEKHATVYNFDQNGVLTEVRDRNNNRMQFSYDPAGRLPIIGKSIFSNDPEPKVIAYDYKLISITDTVGRQINFNYNDDGRLTTITDFAGRTYSYNYDSSRNGDLISFTTPATPEYPSGNTTTYAYTDHNLETITDAKAQTYLTNHYDSEDRVSSQDYGSGTFTFAYDEVNRKTTVTNPKGFVTEWTYDENGGPLIKKELTAGLRPTDPTFFETRYTYNADLERTQIISSEGNGIKYTFDEANPNPPAQGNLLEIRRKTDMSQPDDDTNDIVTHFTYEPNFNFVRTITDPKGSVTTFNYDANGNLTAIIYPEVGGQIPQTTFTYNQYGQIETVTDPNSNLTRYEYYADTGYLHKIIQDPNGINAQTQFTYDSVGNITSLTDANNHTTTFVYNALNQLKTITNPSPFNYQTKYSYDANGNLTKLERQTNLQHIPWQTTEYTYTPLDQLESTKQFLNPTIFLQTTFSYDLNGNRASVTDANNKTTTYVYDERDLIWKTTDALNNTTEYAYDHNGNLDNIKDSRSNETNYAYDSFDRLQTTTYADASYAQYTYDKNSNLSELRTPNSELINYTYDVLNRLDLKTYPNQTTVDYAYDLGSRLTSIVYGLSSMVYTYDTLNRITSNTQTVNSQPYTLNYEYDAVGNRTQLTYPNGAFYNYTYDNLNRMVNVRDIGNQEIARYDYDTLSRRIKTTYANHTATDYQYDLANQLRQLAHYKIPQPDHDLLSILRKTFSLKQAEAIEDVAVPLGTFSYFAYHYDQAGNRIDLRSNNQLTRYRYNNIYELTNTTGAQTHAYQYDNVGNRTAADGVPYTSNNLNQYTQVGSNNFTYDGNGNLTSDGIHTYSYDAENRLITASGGQNSSYEYDGFGRRISKTVDGQTTYFIYDGDRIIEERDTNNTLLASYVYGGGIDEVLTMHRGPQKVYYHYDGLGSVTNLTDTSGNVVESYSYDVYGLPNQTSQIGNRFYFTGRELDEESGLYYYRSRYYSPTIGRFLQRDPIGYYDSMNLYAYVYNNPVNWIDPIGWSKQKSWWQEGWEWYREQLNNPPSGPSYQDPYEIWFTQGVPGWQRAYGSRDIDWRGVGREVGGMASNGYRFYQDVRDAVPPGVPWTGDPRVDRAIDIFNIGTTLTEDMIEEIKNNR
ncbi:MAG: RHS repeat-associated core domain-containing protein [Candidatus Omnitrophota bacterium]|nr:RHS repeat-associated core domain-containing protein [Candidatus Omnitrophota bacterium]